jgi:hypothetical protein
MQHNPDIINRLVDLAVRLHPDSDAGSAMCDAADEIERLRNAINQMIDALDRTSTEADWGVRTREARDLFLEADLALREAVGR